MKHLKLVLVALAVVICSGAWAQSVDTVAVWSSSMKKNIKNVVITPASYKTDKSARFPVVYLLHGAGGDFSNWIKKAPFLPELASRFNMIIVCPDGNTHSWYWDSPVDSTSRYETYMTKELLPYIDKNFRTIASREGRGIAGLSMGGQGSFFLAFRHLDLYGACASMSGGLDIQSFPSSWYMEQMLGSQAEYPDRWADYSIMNQLYRLKPTSIRIMFDCGTDDFFYPVNKRLHELMEYRRIEHDFVSRPGNHSWPYWTNSVKFQLVFFDNYFKDMAEAAKKEAEKAK